MNVPIDITPGGPVPPADPVAARRRIWIGLLAAGAMASVVAGGAGYAAFHQPAERRSTVIPAVPAPVVPFDGGRLPAVPSAVPVERSLGRPTPASPS